jgi:hypothetical protein
MYLMPPAVFAPIPSEAALRLNVLTRYSYTLETIIQAGKLGLSIVSVPVKPIPRNGRLVCSVICGILSRPRREPSCVSTPFTNRCAPLVTWPSHFCWPAWGCGRALAFLPAGRSGIGRYIQSVTIGTGILLVGVLILLFGIQADISSKHRQLTQEMLYRLKKMEVDGER